MTKTVAIEVVSYDAGFDTFHVTVPCPDLGRDTDENRVDVDDFAMPAGLLAHLVGEFDEPENFVGRRFELLSRA